MEAAPRLVPLQNPLLTVTPSAIDFETVRVGTTSSKTVTMTNSGTGILLVSLATLTGSGFSFTGLQLPISLAEGQNLSFNVAFAPPQAPLRPLSPSQVMLPFRSLGSACREPVPLIN